MSTKLLDRQTRIQLLKRKRRMQTIMRKDVGEREEVAVETWTLNQQQWQVDNSTIIPTYIHTSQAQIVSCHFCFHLSSSLWFSLLSPCLSALLYHARGQLAFTYLTYIYKYTRYTYTLLGVLSPTSSLKKNIQITYLRACACFCLMFVVIIKKKSNPVKPLSDLY